VPAHDGDIELADLHLMSDGQRLWCWSVRHGRPVIPVLYSRLAPYLLPPLARFLQRVGGAGCRAPHLWSWGELAYAPFQPRVRYRDTILAPARWVLPPRLTGAAGSRTAWNDALDAWRATMAPAPPQVVITDDGDQRLPLDLCRDDDRELLRRYARRGLAAVCEPPGGPESVQAVAGGPYGRHVVELVIPLQARPPAHSALSQTRLGLPRQAGGGLLLPGGPWLSLTVRAPAACHDQILIRLADLGRELAGQVDLWFWLRYTDAAHGPHLRIRFHGDPAVLGGTVMPTFSAWSAGLIRQRLSGGFSVEPYDQEIERYGGPDMPIRRAEHFFAADSRLALDVLTATSDPGRRLVAAAVSAAAIAATIADGSPDALRRHRLDRVARRRFETLRPLVRAAGPLRDLAVRPDAITAGLTAEAWTARQEALTAYRNVVKPGWRAECGSSLIHMHANRLLGDASGETVARALAADLLALPANRDKP
jgi:thiopeptide-type bacteriocin biosynthesis protein